MCGIFGIGVFTKQGLFQQDLSIFRQGLIADSIRGLDGTGIIRISSKGDTDWRKLKATPFDLFRADGVNDWLMQGVINCDKILIGHNRAASVGITSTENAHPFEHGNIILVHNGNVSNAFRLTSESNKFVVDSEAVCHAMSVLGIKETLKQLRGAYTLVFFDSKEKILHFYRNKERPLAIAINKKTRELVFGSEKLMVDWIIERNNLDFRPSEELPIHTLVSLSLDGKLKQELITPLPEITTVAFENTIWPDKEYESWDKLPDTNMHKKDVPEPPKYEAPKYPVTATVKSMSNYHGVKSYQYPEQSFGYKKGDTIQFIGLEFVKASKLQDQYKVIGQHPTILEMEIHCFVKGMDVAQNLVNASMIEATVRGFERIATKDSYVIKVLTSHAKELPSNIIH